jgi:exodeoxyribonuclease V gamma subunit
MGRGLLPPGVLGEAALSDVASVVEALVAAAGQLPGLDVPGIPMEVNIALPDGGALVGTVPGVREATVLRCTYSKLRPKHRLRAWAHFLALSAARPELAPAAVTIGQAEGSTGQRPRVAAVTLRPLGGHPYQAREVALERLHILVDLYRRGMREPLPLYCSTSAAWATASLAGQPVEVARARWASTFEDFPGEDSDPEHVLALGSTASWETLVGFEPAPDEAGPGWDENVTTRLGRFALRLWAPVLGYEEARER